jgi:hypothetical protein
MTRNGNMDRFATPETNEGAYPRSRLRTSIASALLAILALGVTACEQEGPAERAGKKIDESVEAAKDSVADAAEEAEEQAREVKEEAEEEIKR